MKKWQAESLVLEHPGHPDQKVHGGHGPGISAVQTYHKGKQGMVVFQRGASASEHRVTGARARRIEGGLLKSSGWTVQGKRGESLFLRKPPRPFGASR